MSRLPVQFACHLTMPLHENAVPKTGILQAPFHATYFNTFPFAMSMISGTLSCQQPYSCSQVSGSTQSLVQQQQHAAVYPFVAFCLWDRGVS